MYQPRRLSTAPDETTDSAAADNAFTAAPRRSLPSALGLLRSRMAPTALSAVMVLGVTGLAVNLNVQGAAGTAVAAPMRLDDTSRTTDRVELASSELATDGTATAEATALAEETTAATFAGANWEDSFGAIIGDKYAQADVAVRADHTADAESLGELASGDKLAVTDMVIDGFRQVNYDGKVGWVADSRLGDSAPAPDTTPGGASETYTGSTTYSGPTVLGLKPKAMVVYNAVTAKWSFASIGGYRANSRSNHQYGGAIDFMTYTDSAKGWAVANYLAANAAAFDIDHIIFEQKIWTPYRPYWRAMEDRGSVTANHYDHVHVSVKL